MGLGIFIETGSAEIGPESGGPWYRPGAELGPEFGGPWYRSEVCFRGPEF